MKLTTRIATPPNATPLLATIAILLAPGLPSGASLAEAQEPRRITLEEAIQLFAENNLELRLARADAAEAAGLARQAAAFPNPTLTGTHEPLSDNGQSYAETYLNLSQRLEWPGTRSARRTAAERAAAAARARLAADSARLAFEVKRAFTDAGRAGQTVAILERVTYVFREGTTSAEARYEEGDLSLYDLRRIRLEWARYENRLAEARLEAAAARRELATLVAPDADVLELTPADPLAGRPPAASAEQGVGAVEAALTRRAEVAAAESALVARRAGAAAARGGRIPDLTATGGYKTQSDGFTGVFLGLSLPVPLWDRRGGAIEAAEARAGAAESRATLARRRVATDVRRTVETYRSLRARAELLDQPVPEQPGGDEAGDLLDIARVAYAEGEMELIELLDAAEALMEARVAEARLRAELWIGYYDVERAVGGFDDATNEENG